MHMAGRFSAPPLCLRSNFISRADRLHQCVNCIFFVHSSEIDGFEYLFGLKWFFPTDFSANGGLNLTALTICRMIEQE
jgi:hypothetical protein